MLLAVLDYISDCRWLVWARFEVVSGPVQGRLGAVLGCLGMPVVHPASALGPSLAVLGYCALILSFLGFVSCLSWVLGPGMVLPWNFKK